MTVHVTLDPVFAQTPPQARSETAAMPQTPRVVAGTVVAGLHLALVAALILGGSNVVKTVEASAPITVDVLSTPKPQPSLPQIQPQTVRSKMPSVPAPIIAMATPAPTAIQASATPNPAPAATPPNTVGPPPSSYFDRLLARLNRYKRYPTSARQARIQGVAMLHFVMDRQGRVLSFNLAKSSGWPVLDSEALALIQRAQPLPPIPREMPQDRLDLIVPIEFSLR